MVAWREDIFCRAKDWVPSGMNIRNARAGLRGIRRDPTAIIRCVKEKAAYMPLPVASPKALEKVCR